MGCRPSREHERGFHLGQAIPRDKQIDIGEGSPDRGGQLTEKISSAFEEHQRARQSAQRPTNVSHLAAHLFLLCRSKSHRGNQRCARSGGHFIEQRLPFEQRGDAGEEVATS